MRKKKDKISRLELIEMLSDRAGIPRSKADKALDVLRDVFKEAALNNKKILVRKFFKAEPYVTKARKVKIPKTNKFIKAKPKKKIKIHIADALIEEINENQKNEDNKT